MPPPRKPFPTYRRHKQSGQAIVTLNLPNGSRRDVLLGVYNSPESKAEYARLIAEFGVSPTVATVRIPIEAAPTVNEILFAFWEHAQRHYRRTDGTTTNELNEYRKTLKPLRLLYGHRPATEFGPLALKAVRQAMIDSGLCRRQVNARVGRVKRVFKWAASEELIPITTYQALATVAGLQAGRTAAPETEPVRPVEDAVVEATLLHLSSVVAAMVRFQRLTGCRPQDVCNLRGDEIDRTEPVWVFRPGQHKGAWRGQVRELRIGPRAQGVIAPFLDRACGSYLFSPRASRAEYQAARRAKRKSKLWPSHVKRLEAQRVASPRRTPGARYSTDAYGKSIGKAAANAGVASWHPNQLRHAFATEVRKRFGLEAAQVLLGHERIDVTQVYAERNRALAASVATEIG